MRTTTLEEYAEVNPSAGAIDRASREPVAFVPMAAVSEDGSLVAAETRPLAEVSKGYTYFERNDVLLAKITPCLENGKAVLLDKLEHERGFGSTEFHVLRPKTGVDPRFVFYLVWNQRFRDEATKHMTGSAGQKRVPAGFLRSARVPKIDPAQQRRIADILYKADAIRRKRKEAIALTEELLRSTFLEMFGDPVANPKGWPTARLAELCDKITDGTHLTPKFAATGVPFLFVRNVVSGRLSYVTDKYISEETYLELTRRCPIEAGDVLYVTVGATYGDAVVVDGHQRFCFQRHLAHLKPNRCRALPRFVHSLLRTEGVKRQADRRVRGAAQPTLNLRELRDFDVYLPPLYLQERFERAAASIESSRATAQRAAVEAGHLFASLVEAALA